MSSIIIEPTNLLFLVTLYLIGFTSFLFYLSDKRPETYAGKKTRLPSVYGAKWVIKSSFYGTLVISTLSALNIGEKFLLQLWDQPSVRIAGITVSSIGISLFIISKVTLGGQYSPCSESFLPFKLVNTGIYKSIRHPIYTANLTIFFGAFLATGSLLLAVFLIALVIVYTKTARIEEYNLAENIDGYKKYLCQTGRFLPPIWKTESSKAPKNNNIPPQPDRNIIVKVPFGKVSAEKPTSHSSL